jgi:amidase
MKASEYRASDGLALAERLKSREVTPPELMDCAIALAESRNPLVNALCYTDFDLARELAAQAVLKGTFGALPFLLKDSGLAASRFPTGMGSRLFAGMRSTTESTLSARFMADGLLAFGRTTVPEFNMAPTTEAIQNGGPTRNPWDPSRSSGGSSGGAAAAVALGIVPIAHGSDGGGSIRIPASCCGVYGLKPSRGLTPFGPARGEGWGGLAVDGVLTRTVRDSAAALDGFAGMEVGQPYAAPARPASYRHLLGRAFDRPLRIAKWTVAWDGIAIAPECLAAVSAAERHLTGSGHEVVEAEPPALKYTSFIEAIIDVMAANVAVTVNGFIRQGPAVDLSDKLEPAILDAYHIGQALRAETYALAINRFHGIARLMAAYMADYDIVLTPSLTQLPLSLGTLSTQDDFRSFRRKAALYTAFMAIVNASGQPAASVPLHWTADGIPVGIQLIGRFGAEATVLQLSAQLEQAAPWIHRYAEAACLKPIRPAP